MTAGGVVDLFAGPGGWDLAARSLGLDPIGVEIDAAACGTRDAAGLRTVRGDVAALDPLMFAPVRGLVASAPCPTFSAAGNGGGRRLTALLVGCARAAVAGLDTRPATIRVAREVLEPVYVADDARTAGERGRAPDPGRARERAARDAAMSLLVVEPVRWAIALRPRWVALEQVETVQPLWAVFAALLRGVGYGVWTGVLSAEQYGVPQTRRRAILLASLDGEPRRPPPTHQRYIAPRAGGEGEAIEVLFDAPVERIVHREDHDLVSWVSMAEALGWGMTERPTHTITGGGTRGGGGVEITGGSDVRRIVERERERGAWVYRSSKQANGTERDIGEPAPTLAFGNDMASAAWVRSRPVSGSQQAGAARVTVEEALVLQSFPSGYPLRGSRTKRFEQVGNAVPPPLARACLAEASGLGAES